MGSVCRYGFTQKVRDGLPLSAVWSVENNLKGSLLLAWQQYRKRVLCCRRIRRSKLKIKESYPANRTKVTLQAYTAQSLVVDNGRFMETPYFPDSEKLGGRGGVGGGGSHLYQERE